MAVVPAAAEAPGIRAAYRHCEHITRTQARNFSYGIRLLPAGKRRALSAVYAFARRVDDIGDGPLPGPQKLAALGEARAALARLQAGAPPPAGDLVLAALADASARFALPLGALGELIDGCEADVAGTAYRTFSELEGYCRSVAGSIGRLSLAVFGSAEPAVAAPLADALGIALQLTNILRDIREDLGNGRVYLPAEDLERFGASLSPEGGQKLAGDAALQRVILFEADRARSWYATGMRLMPLLDPRSAASAGAMAGIYRQLLEHIAAEPSAALQRRLSLPARRKALVAARALAGLARSPARRAAAGQAAAGAEPRATAPGTGP